MTLDELLALLAERRSCTPAEARQWLLTLPGGGELVTGAVPPDRSQLVAELLADDPG